MFRCPKCGFTDSPCWRTSKYHPFAVQTTLDELETWEPELAGALRERGRLDRPPYHYRLTKTVRVYRLLIELKTTYSHGGWTEKYRPPLPPGQKKLVEGKWRDGFQYGKGERER